MEEKSFKCECGKLMDIIVKRKEHIFECPKCKTKWKIQSSWLTDRIYKWV
jgi:Zn finger protein HypA/HybF involved in hydrogenase expression